MQVGDFFEAYGVDAVLLVEYCGLNPMGGKAKAGCPKQNLQQTLDCLTSEVHSTIGSRAGDSFLDVRDTGVSLFRALAQSHYVLFAFLDI